MPSEDEPANAITGDSMSSLATSGARSAASRGLRMNPSYFLGWSTFRLLFATYFRWRVYHAERVPLNGPVLLAANHASYLDPPLVGAGLKRPCSFLARETLFRTPLLGAVLRSWECVPVDRDGGTAAGLRVILDRLLTGHAVILFPEGTRSLDGKLQPARAGIGLLVAKSTAPVVPVRVFGSYEAWPKKQRFPSPRRITIKYGVPLEFAELRVEAKSCSKARLKEIYQQIAEEIMAAIARLEPKEDGRGKTQNLQETA
jgi:1-acyl-sn-glycerol-3-phosphate acyltransferase